MIISYHLTTRKNLKILTCSWENSTLDKTSEVITFIIELRICILKIIFTYFFFSFESHASNSDKNYYTNIFHILYMKDSISVTINPSFPIVESTILQRKIMRMLNVSKEHQAGTHSPFTSAGILNSGCQWFLKDKCL